MSEKENQLAILDDACGECVEDRGTLYTEMFQLDYDIRRQIDRCMGVGAMRIEVDTILMKYSQSMPMKDI